MINSPVAVVGGGIAGLTAANNLRRQGVPVILFEAGKQIAGMAASYTDDDGFSCDFGAHFITNRLAAAIGIAAKCRDVKYYGETVHLEGRNHSYPFGLMKIPRFLSAAVEARLSASTEPQSAAVWFRKTYGTALADDVALPLIEAWSGAPATELSVAVANKLSHGVAYTAFLKVMSRWKGLAIANGYSHEMPENPGVWHVYPDGGVASLCKQLAEPLRDAIEMESPVEKIYVERGRAVAIRVRGQDRAVSAVISTAPCNILPKLVEGTSVFQPLAYFRFRPMIFVNLKMEGRQLLPDTVLWTPEKGQPFFRLTETTQSMPWLAPEGKTLITCDIGAELNDRFWRMTDSELGALCIEHLAKFVPGASSRYLGCRVMKTPIAYPVFLNSYESQRQAFEKSSGVDNLISIGRNGEFAHILMEDIYWRTLRKTSTLAASLLSGHKLSAAA